MTTPPLSREDLDRWLAFPHIDDGERERLVALLDERDREKAMRIAAEMERNEADALRAQVADLKKRVRLAKRLVERMPGHEHRLDVLALLDLRYSLPKRSRR